MQWGHGGGQGAAGSPMFKELQGRSGFGALVWKMAVIKRDSGGQQRTAVCRGADRGAVSGGMRGRCG